MVAALYRRYRPESFAEMIGQSQVTDPLMTALRTGRVGHAYLFSGPRGCGKTTSARILARCLNCAEGPTDTPCGTCPSCVELSRAGGGSLDVVEIDAASHGGVDDARDLRERAVFAPARDRFKIFIIDEAHMVTAGGFNALLKIVEEPPPHVKFIFATTEPEKVIGTIRSRTHHYPFRLIPPATLIEYVQTLCDSEGVNVEPGVLPLVVRSGGGSVRDTLSILDQLIAGSEDSRVTAERAAGLLGFTHSELLDDVIAALGAHDAAGAFAATDRVIQTGQDPRRFVEDLLERFRDLIIVNATTVDGAAAVLRGVPQDQLNRMFDQARAFGAAELSHTADLVRDTLDSMTGATPPRLHLELLIARAVVGLTGEERGVGAGDGAGAGGRVESGGLQGALRAHQQAAAQQQAAATQHAQAQQRQAPAVPAAQPQSAPSQPAPSQPAPSQPAVPQPNQPQQAPPQPAQPTQAPHAPQASPAPAQPAAVEPERVANAAETAASIREFLRNDSAGTAQQASPNPHPNEGAAGFGKPISAVLSAAQIESIGAEASAAPAATPTQPTAAAPAAQPSGQEPQSAQNQQPTQAQQPTQTPQPMQTPQPAPSADPVAPAGTVTDQNEAGADETADVLPGFDDLKEMWPDLLDELLESNRDAWNAVRVIEPLALEGDVLQIGVANRSDLAAFKAIGSDPLRETIFEATGVRVRYVPKQVEVGAREHQSRPESERPASDSEEPHRGRPDTAQAQPSAAATGSTQHAAAENPATSSDPVVRAAARLSALGPALAAPAWADPPPAPPAPAAQVAPAGPATAPVAAPAVDTAPAAPSTAPGAPAAPAAAVDYDDEPRPLDSDPFDPDDDPYAGAAPALSAGNPGRAVAGTPTVTEAQAATVTAATVTTATVTTATTVTAATRDTPPSEQEPAEEPAKKAPTFTRYGEAVVREVLGAKFIEERPLPERRR